MIRKGLAVAVILLFIGTCAVPSTAVQEFREKPSLINFDGNTLYVGGSGANNYTTIQSAIDDAVDGDTVYVYDDSSPYYENILIDKSISLIGEDKETTIIDGNENEIIINIIKDFVIVEGFSIINGNYGIEIGLVNNCHITGNKMEGMEYGGISISSGDENLISNNIIFGENGSGGIGVNGYNNNIFGNIVYNATYEGISLGGGGDNTIFQNTIHISEGLNGIWIYNSSNNYIHNNSIYVYGGWLDIFYGIKILGNNNEIEKNTLICFFGEDCIGISILGIDNIVTKNTIEGFDFYGINIQIGSRKNIISNNNIVNNYIGLWLTGAFQNKIFNNNFLLNSFKNAYFASFSFFNTWDGNYWGEPRDSPYLIIGRLGLFFIPWINIDWNPAQEPYDIGV